MWGRETGSDVYKHKWPKKKAGARRRFLLLFSGREAESGNRTHEEGRRERPRGATGERSGPRVSLRLSAPLSPLSLSLSLSSAASGGSHGGRVARASIHLHRSAVRRPASNRRASPKLLLEAIELPHQRAYRMQDRLRGGGPYRVGGHLELHGRHKRVAHHAGAKGHPLVAQKLPFFLFGAFSLVSVARFALFLIGSIAAVAVVRFLKEGREGREGVEEAL